MLCGENQEFFSDLFDGDLAGERRTDLEAHLEACAACREEYKLFKDSVGALQGLGEVPAGSSFGPRMAGALQQERERGMLYAETGMERPSTRRSTVPAVRRRTWAGPVAAAAAACVAFAAGLMIQQNLQQAKTDELAKEIDRLRNRPQPTAAPLEDNVAMVNGRRVPVAALIEQELAKRNLVKTEKGWISTELKAHLDQGEVFVNGAWIASDALVKAAIEDWKKQNPNSPNVAPPNATEEEILAKRGLVPYGAWFVPRDWVDALDRNRVITRTGEVRDLAAIEDEIMARYSLVKYQGRYMTEEQRTELLAAQFIHKSELITQDSAVSRAVDNLEIGPPMGYKNLTFYPLISTKQREIAVTTLTEAFNAGKVELIDDSTALQIHVKNKGASDLVMFAGEILAGGNHGRVVARDVVIPAGAKDAVVDVYDVEPTVNRNMAAPPFTKESGHYWGPLGMRRVLNSEMGQGAVWLMLWTAMGNRASTTKDLYTLHRSACIEYRSALIDLRDSHAGISGVAVAIGDKIIGAEIFTSHAFFVAQFDRIMDSCALEAILAMQSQEMKVPSNLPSSAASVKRLLESVFAAEHDASESTIVVRRNGDAMGRAVVKGDDAIRVTIFADGPVDMRPAPEVNPQKVARILKGYDARLKQSMTPARRSGLFRELGYLPAAAAEFVARHLEESRKNSLVYESAVGALAHIGGEKAVMALIGEIDPAAPDCARVASEAIPACMQNLPNAAAEKAVPALINAMVQITAKIPAEELQKTIDLTGFPFPVRALRLATRMDISKVADFVDWWKVALNREKFFERRK